MRARAARSPSGAPRTVPRPPDGRAIPSSSLTAVVLPAPFGPRNPNTSPGSTWQRQVDQGVRVAVALREALDVDDHRVTDAAGSRGVSGDRP